MDFLRYFRNDDDEKYWELVGQSRQILDWTGQQYHKEFLKWLDEQASKPFVVSDNNNVMIQSAVRANTIREVHAYLVKLEAKALAAVKSAVEE